MAAAQKKIKIPVKLSEFFEVVSDYESYPDFVSSLTRATVIKKSKAKTVVEFEAKIIRPFRYTLELSEKAPSLLSWKLVDGDFMRRNDGRWSLRETDDGDTEATYEIDVELSRLVPGFVTKVLVEESLPTTMSEFKKEAIKRFVKKPRKK